MSHSQFSLRSLLATIAAVGIGAALWTAEPSWQWGIFEVLLLAWVPAVAIILANNSTGLVKAWWTGIAVQCVLPTTFCIACVSSIMIIYRTDGFLFDKRPEVLNQFLASLSASFRPVLLAWAFAPVVGLLCVFTHWLLIRPPQGPKD